ncbi:DUF2264 domain-containing protein [Psittacicella hinzii]|uniref:DUF2264 domain-containing protein n=1 Tax=Psittacicella hinzii TaxID=2028575 RepID=A0A3A1YFW7_9GAMM|nr:DUF2264 domain-containing protein [Psittacicella hinzii]RIY37143.1 hypothetical protein CKF58_05155 [Psittacicella hinzii]
MRDFNLYIAATTEPNLTTTPDTWGQKVSYFWQRIVHIPKQKRYYKKAQPFTALKQHINSYLALNYEQSLSPFTPTGKSWLYEHVRLTTEYILDAFIDHYASNKFTRAYYPGWPSSHSLNQASIEGSSRLLPVLAAYVAHYQQILSPEQQRALGISQPALSRTKYSKYEHTLRLCFLNATNAGRLGYWGQASDYSPLIHSAYDLALALWISRHSIYYYLLPSQQQQILSWLEHVVQLKVTDDHCLLFPLTIEFIIADLKQPIVKRADYPYAQRNLNAKDLNPYELNNPETYFNLVAISPSGWKDHPEFYSKFANLDRYQRIVEFYTSNGWWRDGANGDYDFSNSWSFYYCLYWLQQIEPNFTGPIIPVIAQQWAQQAVHMFTPHSIAFYGKHPSYRLAAATGLLVAHALNEPEQGNKKSPSSNYAGFGSNAHASSPTGDYLKSQEIHTPTNPYAGQYLRAFLAPNIHFIEQGAIAQGMVTSGIFAADRRLIAPESSPATAFGSLRSYTILLYSGNRTHVWTTPFAPLPVELSDYVIKIPTIGCQISGQQHTSEVVVDFYNSAYSYNPETSSLVHQTWKEHFSEWLLGKSTRPCNNLLRKGVTSWSSKLTLYRKLSKE